MSINKKLFPGALHQCKQYLLASGCLLLVLSCSHVKKNQAGAGTSRPAAAKQEGWQWLFDGRTTSGWHTYNRDTVSRNWKVEDGALVMDPKLKTTRGSEDIITNLAYENYELNLEWKITEGGNSGIIFNVNEQPEFPNTYTTGPEMQILDNVKASDTKKENHLAGLLYDMSGTAELSKPKPVGQWNQVTIIQDKGHLAFYFNSIKTLDVQQGGEEWKRMLAASKFRDWKNFDLVPRGRIAFQDHGYGVAFRNIRIRQL